MITDREHRIWKYVNRIVIAENAGLLLKTVSVIAYLVGLFYIWKNRTYIAALSDGIMMASPVMYATLHHCTGVYGFTAGIFLIYMLNYPFDRRIVGDQLTSIGLVNHLGIAPVLQRKLRDPNHPDVTIWIFSNQSIPLAVWEKQQQAIETALDISIVKLDYGKNKTQTVIYAVPSANDLPNTIEWNENLLSPDSFVLLLGESLMGPVSVDLTHIPHILLGGSTGSGKSVLLKLLLMQAVRKEADVYISDFKGGVDFPSIWHKKCHLCFDEYELLELLTSLVEELQRRKELFRNTGCSDLDFYNHTAREPIKRIIFACDEVSELLDKTGLTKDQKELVSKIEGKLSIIARQGRAFGIHMILATQRPDANILPGQIKNNIDCRICGRADNVLSQIILDNADAAEQIPKNARGRFLRNDGTMFQAYWFDEHTL